METSGLNFLICLEIKQHTYPRDLKILKLLLAGGSITGYGRKGLSPITCLYHQRLEKRSIETVTGVVN
jgi:hypothetical protein